MPQCYAVRIQVEQLPMEMARAFQQQVAQYSCYPEAATAAQDGQWEGSPMGIIWPSPTWILAVRVPAPCKCGSPPGRPAGSVVSSSSG